MSHVTWYSKSGIRVWKKTCQQHELPFKRNFTPFPTTVLFPEVDPSTKSSPDRWPHYRDREKSNLSANDDSPVKFQHRNLAQMGSQNPPMCQNLQIREFPPMGFFSVFFSPKKWCLFETVLIQFWNGSLILKDLEMSSSILHPPSMH